MLGKIDHQVGQAGGQAAAPLLRSWRERGVRLRPLEQVR